MPYETELALNGFGTHYLAKLVAQTPDERLAEQPAPGMNHMAWTLGHLAVAYDYVAKCLGQPLTLLRWHPTYAPGTKPVPDRTAYPPKDELTAKLEENRQRILPFVRAADRSLLQGPQPVEFLKPHVETIDHLVAHLLTTHVLNHVGQLSAWRRAAGMTGV
jgi:hypothetical protein